MRVARYVGDGQVAICEEPKPSLPPGGLLVRTEACGLCSGELMAWYMERKVPHVLGHEVAGRVVESDDTRFRVGSRVFPHHHAPCLRCDKCRRGLYVHCAQWKTTKLVPGGMADFFAVPAENLNDTLRVDGVRAQDAALIEPLACVMKSLRLSKTCSEDRVAVVGLGVMGLMHALMIPGAVAYDLNPARVEWAIALNLDARGPASSVPADLVFVCPGTQSALDFALEIVEPGGTIVLFAPFAPGQDVRFSQKAYFSDLRIVHSYSCGPDDTAAALMAIRAKKIVAEQVVSQFIAIEELPEAYQAMKRGEILKPMVVFSDPTDH